MLMPNPILLILTLAVVGFVLWLIENYVPMDAIFKRVMMFVVVLVLIVYLCRAFSLI